jgi:hypothetical protein
VPTVAETDTVTIKEVPRCRRWRIVILAPIRFKARRRRAGWRETASGGERALVLLENAIGAL